MKSSKTHIIILFLLCLILIFLGSNFSSYKGNDNGIKDEKFPRISSAVGLQYEWNVTWGGSGDERCEGIAVDSSGNIYLAGYQGYANPCIVKFNKYGVEQWSHTISEMWPDYGYDVAIDSAGNVFLAGTTETFSATTFPDMMLIKYDSDGNHLWNITWGGTYYEICYALALDSSDDVYLAGWIDDGNRDLCLVKFDNSGLLQWSRRWGYNLPDYAYDVCVDASDNVYIAGTMNRTGSTNSWSAMCFVKYNSSGALKFSRTWGGGQDHICYGIAVDSSYNIYLAGEAGHPGVSSDGMTLIKYDSSGVELWNRTAQDDDSVANDIVIDSSDDIFLGGSAYIVGSHYQMIVARYNPQGDQLWNYTWGGSELEECNCLAFDLLKNVYIAGRTASFGAGGSDMSLVKLNAIPIIDIHAPKQDDVFGSVAPQFNLTIIESNLNSTWYTLNNSAEIPFGGTTGGIDSTEWTLLANGTVSIKFYANNSAGGIGMAEVNVRKDIENPKVFVLTPKQYEFYSTTPPSFSLTISEGNLHSTWYTLNNGPKIPFSGTSGVIDPTEWSFIGNGSVSIKFFANDTAGNEGNVEVFIYKDIENPLITITSPTHHELFGPNPPDFTLSVTETNRNSTWYVLNGGSKIFFSGDAGTIDPIAWSGLPNGTITIRFYINDTAGNENYDEVTIHRDIENPQITVTSPNEYEYFGVDPPDFTITLLEANFDESWYNLNGGINASFSGLSGTINQTEWANLSDGTVIISFYANDTLGNLGHYVRTVNKHTTSPFVSINYPSSDIFYSTTPYYDVDVSGLSIDTTWYNLNGGINVTCTESYGLINQTEWDKLSSGPILFTFFANDSIGNMGYDSVSFLKDKDPPISLMQYTPHNVSNYVNMTTMFYIYADDGSGSGLQDIYYHFNDDGWWYVYSGPFSLEGIGPTYGLINITYYSMDNVGNQETPKSIIVNYIELPPPQPPPPNGPGIPGYPLILFVPLILIGIAFLVFNKRNT
ncbi:MAG: OmpL47-type beta-barrel domain-containing protein [Promethearchaeota archaeon]